MEERFFNLACYQAPQAWDGRIDGIAAAAMRWHQKVKLVDLSKDDVLASISENTIGLLGFACDEGVRRNQGRVGAFGGPLAIKKASSNLPCHNISDELVDFGTILCDDRNLELAQQRLSAAVSSLLENGVKPLLIGGGHEITYGHYHGLKKAYPQERIGIINLDAHFDIREVGAVGATSGTGFWQLAQEEELKYLAIGIQKHCNTPHLFETAEKYNVQVIEFEDFHLGNELAIIQKIQSFAASVDRIYLTIDLDVFSAAYAPGVSAPASVGIVPDHFFMRILNVLFQLPQLASVDIAEYNPIFDQDSRTAKLASFLAFTYVQAIQTKPKM